MAIKLINSIMTKNPCYKAGKTITVKGLMLHSVGCPQPRASAFISYWNSESFNSACVHAFIDANTGNVYQTLPWNYLAWHCAGAANNTHIGVEMCEPDCLTYTGGATFTCSDNNRAKEMVKRTYDVAVELFAKLCAEFKLDPLADGVIVSHAEGYKRGIANNHGDPEHLWKPLGTGYTMAGFRQDVKKAMGTESAPTESTAGSITAGKQVVLNNTKCYLNSLTKTSYGAKSGTFYLWDDVVTNGRIRITNSPNRVGVKGQVTCWVDVSDIGLTTPTSPTASSQIKAGKKVTLNNTPCYTSESNKTSYGKKSGTFYLWDEVVMSGRIRITNRADRVGVKGQVTCWVNVSDLGL